MLYGRHRNHTDKIDDIAVVLYYYNIDCYRFRTNKNKFYHLLLFYLN